MLGFQKIVSRQLFVDFGYDTGTNGMAAFADSETQTFFNCDRGDQIGVISSTLITTLSPGITISVPSGR